MSKIRFLRSAITLSFVASTALAQSVGSSPEPGVTSSSSAHASVSPTRSSSLNTRRAVVQTTGTVIVRMTGQSATTPTDTFTLQKQVFTGSTNCSTGGGSITYVQGLSPSTTDSTSLTSLDSLLLSPFPSSDRNGQYSSFQNSDGAIYSYLPGNAVCVQGFSTGSHTMSAVYGPAIQTMDPTCTSPEFYFNAGDTVCVRASGTSASAGAPWHVSLYGGSVNSCSAFAGVSANITAESQAVTMVLPSSNASIPGACSTFGTTDIRGTWTAQLQDFSNSGKGSINFRLHDGNPSFDLSVFQSASDLSGNSGFPPAGYIKYTPSVQNNGPDAAPNVALVVPVPAVTTFQSMIQTAGPAFSCGAPSGGNVTCTIASLAPDLYASFAMVVTYSGLTNGTIVPNTATVSSSGTDFYSGNNSSSAPVTITNNTNVGQFICPANITVASTSASGRNVTYSNYTTTSTYTGGNTSPSIASGGLFPIGTTSIGWQSIFGSGSCFFNVTVTDGQRPDLTILKTHTGVFRLGDLNGSTYNIAVKNTGGVATIGAVTVTDTLPVGLLPYAISGTGWTCSLPTLSCARADALASNGSYPPITVGVTVPTYLSPSVFPYANKGFVFGGGEGITANDESDDTTSILPPGLINGTTAPGAVTNVLATATTPTNVLVTWNGSCAENCNIYRSADHVNYTMVGVTQSSPFNDPSVVGNTSYLYKVRTFQGTVESIDSNKDLATTAFHNDDPLIAGTTIVKSLHLTQLRTAVNAVRTLAGLGAATFTNSGAVGTMPAAVDINELRTDLDQAMTILGLTTGGYTDFPVVAQSTLIRAIHFQELRNRMK